MVLCRTSSHVAILPRILLAILLTIKHFGAAAPCVDNDAGLKAAVAAEEAAKVYASMVHGCGFLVSNIFGVNACEMPELRNLALLFCPVTCAAPCAAVHLRNKTCAAAAAAAPAGSRAVAEVPALPFCWDTFKDTETMLDLLDEYEYSENTFQGTGDPITEFTGAASDQNNCTCADYPDLSIKLSGFMGGCSEMYNLYLKAHAPRCLRDENYLINPTLMKIFRDLCPMSCGICNSTFTAHDAQRGGILRGQYYPFCANIPLVVVRNKNKTTSTPPIVLSGGESCTLCSKVTVHSNASLHIMGVSKITDTPQAATISGGDATRLFIVHGELILQNIVLKYGFSSADGGAILVESTADDKVATARLIQTTIFGCEAYFNGGAVSVSGRMAMLFLHDGVTFEENTARTSNGGAIHVQYGGIVHIQPQSNIKIRSNSANNGGAISTSCGAIVIENGAVVDVYGNSALGLGGGIYVRGSFSSAAAFDSKRASMLVRGNGTRLSLTKNKAMGGGGGGLALVSASSFVSAGAWMVVRENVGKSGGGIFGDSSKNDGAGTLNVIGNGTRVLVGSNRADSSAGGFYLWNGFRLAVDLGAQLECTENKVVKKNGACMRAQKGVVITIKGNGTRASFSKNSIQTIGLGGAVFLEDESQIQVINFAIFLVSHNTACAGGGLYLLGKSSLTVIKGGTIILEENRAIKSGYTNHDGKVIPCVEGSGGGLAARDRKDSVTVRNGGKLIVRGNHARLNGGGLHLNSGSHLNVHGMSSSISVVDNIAMTGSGGGISLASIATVDIDSWADGGVLRRKTFTNTFASNSAPNGVSFFSSLNNVVVTRLLPVPYFSLIMCVF